MKALPQTLKPAFLAVRLAADVLAAAASKTFDLRFSSVLPVPPAPPLSPAPLSAPPAGCCPSGC